MKWSGLAPAVDTHIARWSQIDRECKAIETLGEGTHDWNALVARVPRIGQWVAFGDTYGLPQADGSIVPGIFLREKGGERVIVNEATISGRDQLTGVSDYSLQFGIHNAKEERDVLGRAVTHYVSKSIVDQVTAAAVHAMAEPLYLTDLVARNGFALLEYPILLPDLHPDTGEISDTIVTAVRAFAWTTRDHILATYDDGRREGDGVQMFIYTTGEDFQEYYKPSYEKAMGEPFAVNDGRMGIDQFLGPKDLYVTDVLPWAFGTNWQPRAMALHEDGTIVANVAYFRRWFMTMMRFCWQHIIVPDAEQLPRSAARRLLRSGKPQRDYTVLRLRKYEYDRLGEADDNEHHEGHALTYRVLVRPHPRWQHYPTLGPAYIDGVWNPESHRQIWITEHFRGPADGDIGPLNWATALTR